MVATASIALVAKADVFNSTSFEGLDLGAITADNKDAFLKENDNIYWTGYSADSDLAVKALGVEGGLRAKPEGLARPLTGEDTKALAIDVDTPLARNIIATEEGAGVPQAIGNGLYFDSMVQFTATTDAPPVTDGDKLIVWLKENEIEGEDSTYALWVTAGVWDDVKAERRDYEITNVNVAPDSWHRLSIAVKMAEGDIPTFNVYVDGVEAKAGDVVDFQSLVYDDGGTLWKQITSVSFEGKGAIDDLVWTDVDPFVAPMKTSIVTIKDEDENGTWTYSVDGGADKPMNSGENTVEALAAANTVVFKCVLGNDYSLESSGFIAGTPGDSVTIWTKTVNVAELAAEYTFTPAEVEVPETKPTPFTVTIDGETKQFETLADAIADAKGAEIKLTEDAELIEKLTVDQTAVIDLNGWTLTLAETDNYAVVVKAALTITDSSSEKSGTVVVPGEYGFGMTAGSLTINAGNFVATDADYLIGAWAGTVAISGGNFTAGYCVVNLFNAVATAEISGGMFTVVDEVEVIDGVEYAPEVILSEVGGSVAVSGGLFSTQLTEALCAEGYIPTTVADSGYYTVVRGYAVTVEADDNAEVSALAAKYAAGATVTFTVTPATDYEVTSVTMNGETLTADNGTYTFTMPATAVTIAVTTEETYKEPTVEPNGDEIITEPISDTAKDVIKKQFPAGGVVIKVEVNGDTLKGDAAVKMINEVVEKFSGNPFTADGKLELTFKVTDVMEALKGDAKGYNLKVGSAQLRDTYQVVPKYIDLATKAESLKKPTEGEGAVIFKLSIEPVAAE